jgi:Uma2 family endonuclease
MATQTHDHPDAAVPPMAVYRFTAEQFRRMIRAGTFADERVELIDGWIVPKMTKHRPHVIAQLRTFEALRTAVPAGWHVEQEAPLTLSDLSTPEPDVMVVRGVAEDYPKDPPTAADVAVVVEVADASLRGHRRGTLVLYAAAGIAASWLVNITERQVEVYTDPTGPSQKPTSRRRAGFRPDDALPLVLDGAEVARIGASEFLP